MKIDDDIEDLISKFEDVTVGKISNATLGAFVRSAKARREIMKRRDGKRKKRSKKFNYRYGSTFL